MDIYLEDLILIHGYKKMLILRLMEHFSSHFQTDEIEDRFSSQLKVKSKILQFEILKKIGLQGLVKKE